MKEVLKKHRYLIAAFIIVILVFLPFVFNDHLFIFAGDSYEQQVKMYVQAWSRLREGSLPFWDWSNFLGNNYYGASAFYFLGSPYFWLAMLVPNKEWLPYSFLTLNIIKSCVCVLFTYLWLRRCNRSSMAASIGGLIITFSGFIMINYTNNHMLDAVCFMPLILYSAECYLQKGKKLLLGISIGILGIVNYYFLYLFLPFLCLYTLIRYFVHHEVQSWKKILKDGIIFLAVVFLGIGLSCIILYPAYIALQENPRVSDFSLSFNTIGKTNIFRFITSFLNPVNDWRQNANFFVSTAVEPGIGWCGGMTNYSLILSVFLMLPLLSLKKSKEKVGILILYAIYLVFTLFPMFYVLFNQNYESRWMMVFPIMNAFMASFVLTEYQKVNKRVFLLSSLLVVIFMSSCFLLAKHQGWVFEFWEVDILKRNIVILSTLVIFYGVLFWQASKLKTWIISMLVLTCVFFEIGFSFFNCFYNLDEYNHPMNQEMLDDLGLFDESIIDQLKKHDDGFYRIDIATVPPLAFNDALSKRYLSFNIYHSIYNYRQADFIIGRFNTQNSWIFNSQKGKTLLKDMLGAKYWFSYGNTVSAYRDIVSYPFEDNVPYGYRYLMTVDEMDVYENIHPISFAYGVTEVIKESEFIKMSQFEQDMILLNAAVSKNKSSTSYKGPYEQLTRLESSSDTYTLPNSDGVVFIELSRNRYNGYSFLDKEGSAIDQGRISSELGYTSFSIPDNAVSFEFDYSEECNIYYSDMKWVEVWYQELSEESAYDVQWSDNAISGTINLKEDKMIVTSVPYDVGWTVKLDGKKIDYEKVNLGFIGFYAESGIHQLELDYIPPGLQLGAIISTISLILLLGWNSLEKRKKTLA